MLVRGARAASSNINPLGYPKILDELIPRGLSALTAYPDSHYRALRQAIADYLACQPDEIMVGNGSMKPFLNCTRRMITVFVCFPAKRISA